MGGGGELLLKMVSCSLEVRAFRLHLDAPLKRTLYVHSITARCLHQGTTDRGSNKYKHDPRLTYQEAHAPVSAPERFAQAMGIHRSQLNPAREDTKKRNRSACYSILDLKRTALRIPKTQKYFFWISHLKKDKSIY